MKARRLKWLIGFIASAIILSSCNMGATPAPTLDVGAIQTEAFNQVMTQAVAAYTPTLMPTNTLMPTSTLAAPPTFAPIGGGVETPTPFAFNTPLPGLTPVVLSPVPTVAGAVATITTKNGCNDGILISESAPYDGAYLEAGKDYQKSFEFLNTGSCAWDEGYVFAFLSTYSTEGFNGSDIVFQKSTDHVEPQKGITLIVKFKASKTPGEHIGVWKLKDDGGNYFGSMVWIKYMINQK